MVKSNRDDKGFTLIEVVVVVVVLALLVLGVTFAYQNIVKLNSMASRRDKANTLATTILDQMSSLSHSDITESNISAIIQYPSYVDAESAAVSGFSSADDGHISFNIDDIDAGICTFNMAFDIKAADYDAQYNSIRLPLIEYLSNEDSLVINDKMDITVFETVLNGSYAQTADREYIDTLSGHSGYDFQAMEKFVLRNRSCLNKQFEEWKLLNPDSTLEYEDSPFKDMEISEDDMYGCMKKTTTLEISNAPSSVQVAANALIQYEIDLELVKALGGDFASVTDLSDLFDMNGDTSCVERYVLANTRYFELSNIYILYWQTDCSGETYIIKNTADLPLSIYFVLEDGYNASEIISENFSNFHSVVEPSNLTLKYEQSSSTIDVAQFYTNCRNRSILSTSVLVNNIHISSDYATKDPSVRLYDLNLTISDGNGNTLCNMTRNILGK